MTTLSILVTTCREMGADPSAVRGRDRRRSLMKVRREVAKRCKAAGHSLVAIGRVLRRHHTSVLWMVRGGKKPRAQVKRARLARAKYLVGLGAGL